MQESLKISGHVKVWEGDKLICDYHNRIVEKGLILFAQRIFNSSVALPSVFKFGDSAALTTSNMESLQGTLLQETSATVSIRENILSWNGSFVFGQEVSQTCREIGLFQAAQDGGVMVARFLPIQSFVLKNGTNIRLNWEITLGE